jgi:hypothetical protein
MSPARSSLRLLATAPPLLDVRADSLRGRSPVPRAEDRRAAGKRLY